MQRPRCTHLLTTLLILTALLGLLSLAEPAAASPEGKNQPVFTPTGEGQPYFVDKKGQPFPVREPLEQNDDKDWRNLRFTDYHGPRITVAVMPVENKTATVEQSEDTEAVVLTDTAAEVPVAAIEELMTTALFNTHRFDLVERKALEQVLSEQDLNASGRVAQPAAAIGQALGAEYLILAAVNEWSPHKSSAGGGGGKGFGGLGARKRVAEVAMSFRLVDSTTGQILGAQTERARIANWTMLFGGAKEGAAGVGGFQKNSPISYAVEACINKAVYRFAQWLEDRSWSGAVVKVDGPRVFINAGSNKGLEAGTRLRAIAEGEELIDPVTGLSLGAEEQEIGTLEVTTVNERFSVASILEGCQGLKPGDRVELQEED